MEGGCGGARKPAANLGLPWARFELEPWRQLEVSRRHRWGSPGLPEVNHGGGEQR